MDELLDQIKSKNFQDDVISRFQELAEQQPEAIVAHVRDLLSIIVDLDLLPAIGLANGLVESINQTNKAAEFQEDIFSVLDKLSNRDFASDEMQASLTVILFGAIRDLITTRSDLVLTNFSILKKIAMQNSAARYSAISPIMTFCIQSPQIFREHVLDIFDLIKNSNDTLFSGLPGLIKYNKDAFLQNLDYILTNLDNSNMQGSALSILLEVSKSNPEQLLPHVEKFSKLIDSPLVATQVVMIFTELVKANPNSILPHLNQLINATSINETLVYYVPNIIGYIGYTVDTESKNMLDLLLSFLPDASEVVLGQVLPEIRNVAEKVPDEGKTHLDSFKTYESHPQEYVRDSAKSLVDFLEGRDLRSIASTINDMNSQFREAIGSMDDFIAYVDENIEMMKEYIADVVKKLPTPVDYSTEGHVRKTIILHFICERNKERCIFPSDRPFTTESKDWSKWLKIVVAGAKIGKTIVTPTAIGSAVSSVKEAYQKYKTSNDEDFLKYIREPFLTSAEQDSLIEQLRKAKYFDVFTYDPSDASWVCTMCNL